jgi:AGZA family xanthine/uracil permease-like MFS transporter
VEKLFRLKENNTTVRKEILAGVTIFFAMAYIIFVNPSMLEATGMSASSVMVATCIGAAIGCFLTAFMANLPFAQAPGMGLNAFFTYTVCMGMGYTWQQALTLVLISGALFFVLSVSPFRKALIRSIPMVLKNAIGAGIGLFIAYVGLKNAGIIAFSGADAASATPGLGNITAGGPLLAVIGLLITGVLMAFKVKGAIFIGIIASTIIGIPLGVTVFPESLTMTDISLAPTFFQFDFGGLMSQGLLALITVIISFTVVDMFDTVGTLIGTANRNGMLDKDGNLPRGDRALIADAIATMAGACLGTSTVTTFVESSTGISEGGRTGLTSVIVGVLFLVAILLAPIAGIIPSAATAPALIIVGVLMLAVVKNIDWHNFEDAFPAFMTIAIMPLAYSIAEGIGFGFISYTVVKMCRGKFKEIPVLMYILSAIFILRYILINV